MVEQLNQIARLWWDWSAAMFWQAGLLILLIGCIDLLIRKWAWPQLRYALWSLILVKLLLPPTLSLPSGIVPELRPAVSQALRLMNADKPVVAESSVRILGFDRVAPPNLFDGADSPRTWRFESPRANEFARATQPRTVAMADSLLDAIPQSAIHNPQLAWQVYAMLAWLAGTLILGIWLFLRLHSFCSRHAYRAAAASLPQSFYNQLADCANRLGLRHIPRVVVTKRLASPAVFGAVRPVLLVPKGYLSKLSRRDTEHMLLHELAHVKRGDLIMHSLYMLLQIAYWYNPLLWLVRRQMHHLRELSCDATVANLLRERTLAYRQTLLETARRLLAASVEPGLGLLGLFEDSNRLLVRLNWLTKPTWRYRTMKRTIVVAIAALMIACVLPMAQARQAASNEIKDVTQNESISVSTEERIQPSQDQMSQDLKTLQKRLDQMMGGQQQLQNQLRALAERRHAMSPGQEQGDQSSQDLGLLQKHLDELTIQQKDLQKQLRALADERRLVAEGRRERQREPAVGRGGGARRERADEDIDVTVSPRESPDRARPPRDAAELRDEAGRELQERERTLDETRKALDEAKRAFGEARDVQVRVQRQSADRAKAWGAELEQWQQSEQMQQWRREMEKWQRQVQEWAQNLVRKQLSVADASPDAAKPAPMPPMPRMPEMPKMPGLGKSEIRMRYKSADPASGDVKQMYEDTNANFRDVFGGDVPSVNAPRPEMPAIEPPLPPVPPMPPIPPEVPAKAEGLEEVVHRNGFGRIPGDRVLDVSNHVGSITVRSGDKPEYIIRATIKGRAETQERAREITERLEITNTGAQGDGVERMIVSKPQDLKDRESCVVEIEVTAPRNARLKLRQEVGDIRLIGLRGSVEAFARVGAIRAADVAGQVALNVEVGGIDLAVPQDLSAKVQAKAELGGIQSDLPLEFAKTDGLSMGHSASGTIGQGDDNISLSTKMGSIRIRSQASEPDRAERSRREPRPEPRSESRSEPRPEPRPEGEF